MPVLLLLLTLLPAVLAQGCGHTAPYAPGSLTTDSIVTSGDLRNRTFAIRLPSGYVNTKAYPVLFGFHGFGGNGITMAAKVGFNTLQDPSNFIAVYPDGFNATWNAGSCCSTARILRIDDVGFVRQLLDKLIASLCVDESRFVP